MVFRLRTFEASDWASVSKIYAEGLATKIATFETEVPSYDVWDDKYIKVCRIVAMDADTVIGFAVLSKVSSREVYKGVAEVSVYVSQAYRGQGAGKQLLEALIKESEQLRFWTLQASIFSQNKSSIKLHQSCGFKIVGVREKIAKRDDQWHDNVLLEKRSEIIN